MLCGGAMRALPLGPSVEPKMKPRAVRGACQIGMALMMVMVRNEGWRKKARGAVPSKRSLNTRRMVGGILNSPGEDPTIWNCEYSIAGTAWNSLWHHVPCEEGCAVLSDACGAMRTPH
eukprot:2525769-Pyramimonas_sp.AAC.1